MLAQLLVLRFDRLHPRLIPLARRTHLQLQRIEQVQHAGKRCGPERALSGRAQNPVPAHPLPIASYVEQQRSKGKSYGDIAKKLDQHATKGEEPQTEE